MPGTHVCTRRCAAVQPCCPAQNCGATGAPRPSQIISDGIYSPASHAYSAGEAKDSRKALFDNNGSGSGNGTAYAAHGTQQA